ncbi:hypothetical protein G7Y89_g13086 [Cudoniella acicularis]|uniref:NADP-dependent oxidoreductase domain-containing protein n=1 Tax=Cudoniella acicularis TaxID=354080 RepID=A0A8H4R9Z3_9HELO|nr:hypothetical protein G7Y89_g13086 [Cudoniella acicularis]
MAQSPPKIIFGAAWIAAMSPETINQMFDILKQRKALGIDTASIYTKSEATIGSIPAAKNFEIHTKAAGFAPGAMSKKNILNSMERSLKDLGVESVDLYYLHSPDPITPIEESLSAIQELYTAGKFKRFGISNFLPSDVQKIYDIQKAANSVLPTVFQGNYNAMSRHVEEDLFPLLRKLDMHFYAYSPIAGGFLVKDPAQLRTQSAGGRFENESPAGKLYNKLYGKESLFKALETWGEIAKDAGFSKAALAYRWIVWHSALNVEEGDALIVGASKVAQLEETLDAIDAGPLDEKTVERVTGIWEVVKADAPRDNWNA